MCLNHHYILKYRKWIRFKFEKTTSVSKTAA